MLRAADAEGVAVSEEEMEYQQSLQFLTDDPKFALGFEMGRLWEQAKAETDDTFVTLIHAANEDQARLIAARTGWRVMMDSDDSGWTHIRFTR